MISQYIEYLNWSYVIYWIIAVAVIIFIWVYLNKSHKKCGKYVKPILIIALIRLILFDNIASWACYYKFLSQSGVGFRQHDLISHEIKRFLKWPKEESKYLAVGTSQTGAIYGKYSKEHDNFQKIEMAGLGPLDMYLYRKYIVGYKPQYILLYLSEFDLTRELDLNLAKISPYQKLHLFELYPDLYKIAKKYKNEIALKEMIVGEFLPEYKYSYIFKGIINKFFLKDRVLEWQQGRNQSKDERLRNQARELTKKFNIDNVSFNIKFLKKFLTFCVNRNISIVIVEGQYNPIAYDEKALKLNKIIRENLKKISDEYKNVQFIPRTETIEFTENDYCDAYHVTGPKIDLFVQGIMENINSQ